jgi:hypothetical protein
MALTLIGNQGCGSSDRASVTGKLLRSDGSPLVGARIIATSAETGKSAYGTTDKDGEFTLGVVQEGDGVPPGDYKVMIMEDLGDPDNRSRPTIAAKYRNPEMSGLSLSVEAGQNVELNQTLEPR